MTIRLCSNQYIISSRLKDSKFAPSVKPRSFWHTQALIMDRRSFDLNYENNILFYDPALTAEVRRRQDAYLASSHPVTAEMVAQWPMTRRLWNNTIAMLGPIL